MLFFREFFKHIAYMSKSIKTIYSLGNLALQLKLMLTIRNIVRNRIFVCFIENFFQDHGNVFSRIFKLLFNSSRSISDPNPPCWIIVDVHGTS